MSGVNRSSLKSGFAKQQSSVSADVGDNLLES